MIVVSDLWIQAGFFKNRLACSRRIGKRGVGSGIAGEHDSDSFKRLPTENTNDTNKEVQIP